MMSFLKINSILHTAPADPDLKAIQEYICPIISIILDENIKQIYPIEPLLENVKKSFRLILENGTQLEIGMINLSSRRLFKGLFKLAKKLEQDENSIIKEIVPASPDSFQQEHSKSIAISTEAGRYEVGLRISNASFEGLVGILSEPLHSSSHCPDFLVQMELFANASFDSRDVIGEAAGWIVRGSLNEFGDLVVTELSMSDESKIDSLRADIKIGSICLKIQDLLSLKPGSSIEIDWPENARAALMIGDKPWTQVKIQVEAGKMSFILPEDATFPS
jgi:hypothetical protein